MEFLEIIILPLIKKIEQDARTSVWPSGHRPWGTAFSPKLESSTPGPSPSPSSVPKKIEQDAQSQEELSGQLKDIREKLKEIWEKVKEDPRNFKLRELLTQICCVEDTIDSIIASKMLRRQNISIEKVPVKYFEIAKGCVKFGRELNEQTKKLKEKLNDFLPAPVPEERSRSDSDAAEGPEKESSGNTVPQKKSSKDERHHQSWEEGCIPIVLEELVSKLAQPVLLSRRLRQLLILKANLECRSDAIFLWTSYHSSVTKQHFQFCCWVPVSKKSEERNILGDILKQVPSIEQEASEQSNQILRRRLHDFLVFKRYLIVLYGELGDDVWDSLKSAFPYSLNGSRVLLICKGITSTNFSKEWSSQQLGKSKDYLLEESKILSMEDITELFQSILNQCKLLFLISIVGVAESEKKTLELEKKISESEKKTLESGKKTFLWAMYSAEDVKQLFQYRAWVRVPKQFKEEDLQNLLADILKQVTGDNKSEEKNRDLEALKTKLWNFLASKRYLIVLYDVWTADVWDKLRGAFPNHMNGSRVILTVHEADVYWQTNSSRVFRTVGGKELLPEKFSNPKVKHRWGIFSDVKANESDLVGLDDKVQELAELLLESYQFLISVVGVAGSGKTMLVKEIYSSFAIKQHFECRAFISVSQEFEERKLFAELSMQLGMGRKDESWSEEELQKRLRLFLAWKRYLIVLDDVYTADVWEKLSAAFPNSSNGSRVMLTTRYACVPRNIKAHTRDIQLRFLNDDESWELFKKKVPEDGKNAELMKAFKEKILQKCGGLPLDIVVLGGLLSTTQLDISEWSKFIDQVSQKKEKKGRVTDEDGVNSSGSSDKTLSGILALGYQDLSSNLKFCLNYLGLFPKSKEVPFRRLFQLLQAEGFLKPETNANEESFEEQVKKYIEDLKKRNMIEVGKQKLNGSPKTICMQSTIYDALSPRALRAGLFHFHFNNGKEDAPKEYIRRLAEHQEISYDRLPEQSCQLRSYISFKTEKGHLPAVGVDKLLKEEIVKRGFGLIVILDLEGVYKPELSKHLGKFPNLKYLGLRWTSLDSIPDSVGDLPCLETFDVKHTNISTLPGEFWKAKHLQYLYMSNICVDSSILKASQTDGSLTKLQTLSGLVIRNKDSLGYLKEAKRLRKLGVTCYGESIEEIVGEISMLTQLQSLKLRSIDKNRNSPPSNLENLGSHDKLLQLYLFGKLPEKFDFGTFSLNLEILTLAMSELSDDPMEKLGQLKSLKILRLHARSYLGRKLTCLSESFPQLKVLKLWKLEKLEKWKVKKGAMPALEEVEIRCCNNLNKADGLKELTTLKELLVTSMEQNFVKKLKESLGSNVLIVKENDWKFSTRVTSS